MEKNKIFSLLGLAQRSGNLASGEFMAEKTVKSGKACLVIVSTEASDNTRKKFTNMCSFYQVPIYFYGSKEELGYYIGKEMRTSLAVTEQGFANKIRNYLEAGNEYGGNKYDENKGV